MSLQRGKPEPEVIVNVSRYIYRPIQSVWTDKPSRCQFADGLAYNKAKLEAAVFGGTIFSGKPPKHAHKDTSVKDDDVALIVCPTFQAF